MAIATVTRTDEKLPVVYVGDPDVTPNDPLAGGWVLKRDANCKKGADVVVVTGLSKDQRDQANDGGGAYKTNTARCRGGIVSVNGKTDAADIEAFLESHGDIVILMLGCFIRDITDGDDPQESQRGMFRRASNVAAVDSDEGEAEA